MKISKLYRKRFIPDEYIFFKDDIIVRQSDDVVVTRWNTLKPKEDFSHGVSCYFLKEGWKLSKIYRRDGSLVYWYFDIVEYSYREKEEALVFTDLLADVIIYPDGKITVVDLDELAFALEEKLITEKQMTSCLHRLHHLLSLLYNNEFEHLQTELEGF